MKQKHNGVYSHKRVLSDVALNRKFNYSSHIAPMEDKELEKELQLFSAEGGGARTIIPI